MIKFSKGLKNKKIVMMVVTDVSNDMRVLKEARSARKAGMKVVILAKKSLKTKFKEKVDSEIEVIRFQSFIGQVSDFLKKQMRRTLQTAKSERPIVQKGWLASYLTIIDMILINRQFAKIAALKKPDLIHANDSLTLPAALKLKKSGFRVLYDAHELFSEYLTDPPLGWRNYFTYIEKKIPELDGFFSVCQSIIDEIDRRYHTWKLPRAILYNAPPYRKKVFRKSQKPLKLLFIGTSYPLKDFKIFYKIMGKLKNITLTNIGPDWGEGPLTNIINKSSIPFNKLIDEACKYDIGLVPYIPDSLNRALATPNKLFTYMMAGLAIASSNIVEVRKIINQNNNGVLFKSQNTHDIQAKISYLEKNPKILEQFKINSLKAAKKYCWEDQEKKQLALYEKILE